jgi:hypothetical protein
MSMQSDRMAARQKISDLVPAHRRQSNVAPESGGNVDAFKKARGNEENRLYALIV